MKRVRFATTTEGKPVEIDIQKLVESRLLVQASSGGGKSYALRKILEVTHGHVQQIVLDPDGEFGSLRQKFEFLQAGKGGDVPAEPRSAELLAEKLLELGTDAIVDLYEMKPQERKHFVRLFCEAIVNARKELWHPVLILVDEAHVFCPEAGQSEAMGPVIDLASRGRKREYALMLATQRISKLHKDAAAECQNKLIGVANLDIDRKRSGDELGFRAKEDVLHLRDLDPGEMFVIGPAFRIGGERVKEPVRVKVDEVETPHGRQAKTWHGRKVAPTAKIKAALKKLTDLPKQAEELARDRESLVKKIRDLEREKRELARGIPKEDPEGMKRAYERGVEVATKEIRKMKQNVQAVKMKVLSGLNNLVDLVESIQIDEEAVAKAAAPVVSQSFRNLGFGPTPASGSRPAPQARREPVDGDERGLSPTQVLILQFLASRLGKPFSRAQIGVQIRRSRKSSSFDAAFPGLERQGLVTKSGLHYLMNDAQVDSARALLGGQLEVAVNDRPEDWLPKLKPTPRLVFEVLLSNKERALSREEISEITGRSMTSSSFDAAFPELERLGLLKKAGPGMVQFNTENFG